MAEKKHYYCVGFWGFCWLIGWLVFFFFCLETKNLFSGRGLALFLVQWRDVTMSTPEQTTACCEAKLLAIYSTEPKMLMESGTEQLEGISTVLSCKGRQRECLNLWRDGVVCESGPLASSWLHAVECLTTAGFHVVVMVCWFFSKQSCYRAVFYCHLAFHKERWRLNHGEVQCFWISGTKSAEAQ